MNCYVVNVLNKVATAITWTLEMKNMRQIKRALSFVLKEHFSQAYADKYRKQHTRSKFRNYAVWDQIHPWSNNSTHMTGSAGQHRSSYSLKLLNLRNLTLLQTADLCRTLLIEQFALEYHNCGGPKHTCLTKTTITHRSQAPHNQNAPIV